MSAEYECARIDNTLSFRYDFLTSSHPSISGPDDQLSYLAKQGFANGTSGKSLPSTEALSEAQPAGGTAMIGGVLL